MNSVILMGRITADPELRTTNSGTDYCRFTVAIDRYSKSEDKKTDFINCVAWRQTAEFVSRYFTKGQMIAVEGSIQTGSYTNKDGAKVYTTDVLVDNVSFTGSKRESGGSGSDSYGSNGGNYGGSNNYSDRSRNDGAPASSYSSGSAGDFQQTPIDDDLPF